MQMQYVFMIMYFNGIGCVYGMENSVIRRPIHYILRLSANRYIAK